MKREAAASYSVALARIHDLPALASVELAAARLLVGHAPESVLAESTPLGDFEAAQRNGLLWVALDGENPVGFAHVKLLEPDSAHLDELDVHPAHGRRGLGTRLVNAVCSWATDAGLSAVTLCTFRGVPWNMPFYARLGFTPISPLELSDQLRCVVDDETRRGLDPRERVVMRRLSFDRSRSQPITSRRDAECE
jgi:GNAT superfamily N-acetyltransferase